MTFVWGSCPKCRLAFPWARRCSRAEHPDLQIRGADAPCAAPFSSDQTRRRPRSSGLPGNRAYHTGPPDMSRKAGLLRRTHAPAQTLRWPPIASDRLARAPPPRFVLAPRWLSDAADCSRSRSAVPAAVHAPPCWTGRWSIIRALQQQTAPETDPELVDDEVVKSTQV